MSFIFFIPLSIISVFETSRETKRESWMEQWLLGHENGEEDSPQIRNPEVDDPTCPGKQISRVPFEELIKVFPNTQQVCSIASESWIADKVTSLSMQLF